MADNARGVHVSPGIYSREVDLTYAVKSLGITTLGLAGETQRGPAFQPMHIENWREFVDVFGGTSTEKYKGSQYPKYELPYIAKSYLTESKQLEVVRVLGLSGYKAGPAWIITASKENDDKKYAVAVLRPRGHYEYFYKYTDTSSNDCLCQDSQYDKLVYEVGEQVKDSGTCVVTGYNNIVELKTYTPLFSEDTCNNTGISGGTGSFDVSSTDNGRFKIVGLKGEQIKGATINSGSSNYFEYAVSLNPFDKEFILKVLGTDPQNGEAPLYVESLYEEALHWMIESEKISKINPTLEFYQGYDTSDYSGLRAVNGIIDKKEDSLTRKDLGKRFLIDLAAVDFTTIHEYDEKTNTPVSGATIDNNDIGRVVTVKSHTDNSGKRHYYYAYYNADKEDINAYDKLYTPTASESGNTKNTKLVLVKNNADGLFYKLVKNEEGKTDVGYINCDLHNYSESYRFASTPWIVSNLKGDYDHIEINKLFRFHTISDGSTSNREIKVSIENILPDSGEFDVIIRDINDVDESIVPLEKYARVNLIPGDRNYIAFRIGSFDGAYESKSKYVTVEVNETITTQHSVPAGFLGYPRPEYSGITIMDESHTGVVFPDIKYNRYFDSAVKNRKQYFGLSTRTGIDVDLFTYKGIAAYINDKRYSTKGFHLDSRLDVDAREKDAFVTVEGEKYPADYFETVAAENRTELLTEMPIIGTEEEMRGSIYEYKNLRKFTVYFYGGFDGWDIFRDQRSNGDEFKVSNYRGIYDKNSGEGRSFNKIWDPEALQLNQEGITSDWYAYLSAYRQFANPEAIDINVFATPGIDYVNNKTLVQEVIDMLEEERADSIYVVTTPDKPEGAGDYVDEMFPPDEVVYNLEETEIDSNYTCTYYPWVKYLDQDNNQYIYLPATKDVVRNFAQTDNTTFPWFAPAGINRGDVNCVRAHYITKLEDEDILYEGRINPVKTFAQDGVKLWGQKNLQVRESQLNRIAVRRLLLRMRKLIAIACRSLIFEPNDPVTKNMFLTAVTPIMDNIRANRGISDYRIEVNDTVEARDRRELPAKIYFKPYNALEYIDLTFVLSPEGISFDNI